MTKDYYKILGITYPSNPEEINCAYREMAKKWHPDLNPGKDVTRKMQDINEAAEILRDLAKKARYDAEYQAAFGSRWSEAKQEETYENPEYDVKDEALREDIIKARRNAEEYVRQFMEEMKKTGKAAAKGAWQTAKPFVIIFLVIAICAPFCKGFIEGVQSTASTTNNLSSDEPVEIQQAYKEASTSGWKEYTIRNSFNIKIPPTVEMRHDYDRYVRTLQSAGISVNSDDLIFEPNGISSMDSEALQKYSRIIIQYERGKNGDFLSKYESPSLSSEDKSFFYDMVVQECVPYGLSDGPYYSWKTLPSGTKALEIKYRRNGSDGVVAGALYFLFNNSEVAKIILTYREREKSIWLPDFDNVISTFKWAN